MQGTRLTIFSLHCSHTEAYLVDGEFFVDGEFLVDGEFEMNIASA